MSNLRQAFPRTICGCDSCVACCKHMPGSLIPGDLPLIMEHQGAQADPTAWLLAHFEASDGAIASKEDDDGQRRTYRIPTIVPKLTPTGCIFLKEGKCTIHAVAPFGCAFVDTHMVETAMPISLAMINAQWESWQTLGSYAQAWNVLAANGQRAIPLVERKAKLREETLRIEAAHENRS